MDKKKILDLLHEQKELDYGLYLKTSKLLRCQKTFSELVNEDELQFQIVHQVEELWMKLLAYTLGDIIELLRKKHTYKVLTKASRVHKIQRLMTSQLALLETMSPRDYQQIRLLLGAGSGQESPGFRVLLQIPPPLYKAFCDNYLTNGRTVESIYDTDYQHCDAYMIAESLAEFDELFQKFRYHHIKLVQRSIGDGVMSIKGRSVDLLQKSAHTPFFPELWEVRSKMTERWGAEYGFKRDHLACPATRSIASDKVAGDKVASDSDDNNASAI